MSASGSFAEWADSGRLSQHWREIKASGRSLAVMTGVFPAGDLSSPVTPDLLLCQDIGKGGMRLNADMGGGRFQSTSEARGFYLVAADYSNSIEVDATATVCDIAFDTRVWRDLLDGASDEPISFDFGALHRGMFTSTRLNAKVQSLRRLVEEEGRAPLLLAQAAGCEILAELHRLSGSRLSSGRGGLSPWAERRCVELMRARMAEDISIADLAAEARLSVFHFTRMFKRTVGMSPREYLVQIRIEKARELLVHSDLTILEVAQELGYSSGQVLARAFAKNLHVTPREYRARARS